MSGLGFWGVDSFENDFNYLLSEFKRTESKTIKLKINWIHHNLPNLQINNLERTLEYNSLIWLKIELRILINKIWL